MSALAYSIILGLPNATFLSFMVASTPFPVTALKSSDFKISALCSLPYLTVASAKGCSLLVFNDTMYCNTSFSLKASLKAPTVSTVGFPSVIVPVLSTISVFTLSIFSRASAFLINTPF